MKAIAMALVGKVYDSWWDRGGTADVEKRWIDVLMLRLARLLVPGQDPVELWIETQMPEDADYILEV